MQIITDIKKLRQVSRETTAQEVSDLNLVHCLREANKKAWTNGAGLAAIQIGIPVRFSWYVVNGREQTLLNPVILNKWGSDIQKEGCLSIPNTWRNVDRAWTIEYLNRGKKRKVSGFEARLIQHEIDHMDGILIIDKK